MKMVDKTKVDRRRLPSLYAEIVILCAMQHRYVTKVLDVIDTVENL